MSKKDARGSRAHALRLKLDMNALRAKAEHAEAERVVELEGKP